MAGNEAFMTDYLAGRLSGQTAAPKGWDCVEGDDTDGFTEQYAEDTAQAELDDCADDADCIEDGDWTTDDGCKFYADGELVLDTTDMTDAQAARAAGRIMRAEGFFPNIWHVSDHGNVAAFTFE